MKIVFATDGSEHSADAARFLSSFNLSENDEIKILHAISWFPVMHEWESLIDDFQTIREDVVPKILGAASEILSSTNAKITTTHAEDFPDRAILDTAESSDTGLIVMGASGLRGIASHIVGSVTKKVAAKAHIPVLIVRSLKKEVGGRPKILFATDGSEHADATAAFLTSVPFPKESEMTILNVSFSTLYDIPDQFSMEVDTRIKNIIAGTHEEASRMSTDITTKTYELLKNRFPGSARSTKFGDPPLEILSAADEMGADMIALGSSGKRGILKSLGSVSRYVLNHATCSVLVGR